MFLSGDKNPTMPTLKLPAVMAQASQHYRAQLNGQVQAGKALDSPNCQRLGFPALNGYQEQHSNQRHAYAQHQTGCHPKGIHRRPRQAEPNHKSDPGRSAEQG